MQSENTAEFVQEKVRDAFPDGTKMTFRESPTKNGGVTVGLRIEADVDTKEFCYGNPFAIMLDEPLVINTEHKHVDAEVWAKGIPCRLILNAVSAGS